MGRLLQEHEGWTREDLDEMFGPHPDHASAPTRAQLAAELAAEVDDSYDDLDEDEPSLESWTSISDEEIKAAVREIVRTSSSDEENQRRVADELGYPFDLAITSHTPTDQIGREARVLVTALGGLIRQDGAMVMIMLHGSRGNTISI